MLIKAQIQALPNGTRFKFHPMSNKVWVKESDRRTLSGRLTRIFVRKIAINCDVKSGWTRPNDIVYAISKEA